MEESKGKTFIAKPSQGAEGLGIFLLKRYFILFHLFVNNFESYSFKEIPSYAFHQQDYIV
jgi:hypothetical protein